MTDSTSRMQVNVTNEQLMYQGAEAKCFKIKLFDGMVDAVLKQRFKKAYRHPVLDSRLTKVRTRL